MANPDEGQVTSSWNHFLSTTQSSQDILWWGGGYTGYRGETPFHHSFNKVHTMWRVGKKSLCDPHHWKPLSSGPELKWLKSPPWREAPAGETDLNRKGNKLQAVPEERPPWPEGCPRRREHSPEAPSFPGVFGAYESILDKGGRHYKHTMGSDRGLNISQHHAEC